jgi:hypothetical protein
MPLIKIVKNEKEFHLELWNEPTIVELGLAYEIVPIGKDRDYLLYSIEQLQSLIEPN